MAIPYGMTVPNAFAYEAQGYKNVSYKPGEGRAMIGQTPTLVYTKAGSPSTQYRPIYADMAIQAAAPPPPPPTPAPAPAPAASPTYGKTYNYTDPGDKGYFGMKDYEELASQGASKADLIRYAFSAPSGVGPAAAQRLGIRAYDQPIPSTLSYTDPGDKGFFGIKDFEELASQGASLQQIQDYAKKAKYGVGEEAASILGLKPVGEAGYTMAQADKIVASFEDAQKRAEEAAKLQEQLRIKSQGTLVANMARSQMTPNLQIQPASGTPQTAGTQSFRRRQSQFTPRGEAGAVLAGLNLGQSNMLNV